MFFQNFNYQKVFRCLSFISLLRVEPFMILFAFSLAIRKTPLEQLIQDKLCRQKYNMTAEYCFGLSQIKSSDDNYSFKSLILSDAVQYNMYHTLITVCPSVIWSLFLGSFVDNYKHGRKVIFLIGSLTSVIEASMNAMSSYFFELHINYILASFIPYAFSGSMTWITSVSYLAATTPNKWKTIRMTILDLLLQIAHPLGTAVAGKLIMLKPLGGNGQLHNYFIIFALSSLGNVLAFLWALFMINEQKNRVLFEEKFGEKDKIEQKKSLESKNTHRTENTTKKIENVHPLRILFNISNIYDIIKICTKKRDNHVRFQIWLIYLAMFTHMLSILGPASFAFQFCQKIYFWDAETYSYISSLGIITHAITMMAITPILIKCLKLNDMVIAIIGNSGVFFQCVVRGVILTQNGYFISILVGSTAGIASIGFKSHISKIVTVDELGKVFTLMSIIDATAPILSSTLFTFIFKATIDSIPSFSYLLLSAICLVPILISIAIDLFLRHSSKKQNDLNNNIETKL